MAPTLTICHTLDAIASKYSEKMFIKLINMGFHVAI